jgi:dTDP-4-dehydrorhamnose 3,5-epimerase
MGFKIESTQLGGDVVVLVPQIFEDARGYFMEAFRADFFESLGLPTGFVQDNQSQSKKGVVRGLHFQWEPPMGKLMRVVAGSAFLVAVDIRKNSPTLGKWFGIDVTSENKRQIWAPAGFARGFCVTSDTAEVQYKCTCHYNAQSESGIRFNDPQIAIEWPQVGGYLLSDKDRNAQTLAEWLARPESSLFRF